VETVMPRTIDAAVERGAAMETKPRKLDSRLVATGEGLPTTRIVLSAVIGARNPRQRPETLAIDSC